LDALDGCHWQRWSFTRGGASTWKRGQEPLPGTGAWPNKRVQARREAGAERTLYAAPDAWRSAQCRSRTNHRKEESHGTNPATTSLPPGGTEADWIELGKIPAWHTPFSPLHSADVLQAVVFFSADHPGPPAGFAPGLLLRQLYAVFPRAKSHNCWAGQGNAGRWLQDWGR
jgi:hypothetical protein